MNEKPSAWTPEEKSALFAAVEQCRANGGQLDWDALPPLSLGAAHPPWKSAILQAASGSALSYKFFPPHRPPPASSASVPAVPSPV